MSKSTQKASGDRAKCDGPIEAFVAFAKRLTAESAQKRLQKLAEGPDAARFAERLVQEGFGDSAHAAMCMSLIGRLKGNPDWVARLQAIDAAGDPPAPDRLQPKQLALVGNGLLVISREKALPWLARAYFCMKSASNARTAVEKLLLEAAPTPHALAAALADALGATEASGQMVTKGIAGRSVDILEKYSQRVAGPSYQAEANPLARWAAVASKVDAARLVSALLLAQTGGATADGNARARTDGDNEGPPTIETAIAETAWTEADEALGRALQDMDLLDRSLERLESTSDTEIAERARKAKGASNLVLQWVRQAARHRSVAVLNKVGDRVPFDPAMHDLYGHAAIGDLVRVVKPAVVRGREPQQVVVVRGEAEVD